jgi:hypothetical protein
MKWVYCDAGRILAELALVLVLGQAIEFESAEGQHRFAERSIEMLVA